MQALIDALLRRFADEDTGLIAVVDLTVWLAVAGDRVADADLAALKESIEALVGARLTPALVDHLVTGSVAQLRALGVGAVARELGEVFAELGAAEEGIRLALALALASSTAEEGLSAAEIERIDTLAEAASISKARVEELFATIA